MSAKTTLVCWKCGASIEDLPLPLGRLAECAGCGTDLHVCRLCEFYDPRVAKSCREPIAEEVKDKDRSNFCDYFKARPGAWQAADDTEAAASRAKLGALFGLSEGQGPASPAGGDAARTELEKLFGLDDGKER